MEPIKVKNTQAKIEVNEACIDGSTFINVMLKDCLFNDVMMAGTKIINANLSELEIEGAQLGGAYIHNIGMPPEGHPLHDPRAKMRPLKMEDCYLVNSVITHCDLGGVEIKDCNIRGLTIDGVDVSRLLEEFRKK